MKVTCKKCSKDFPYEKYNGVSRSQDSKTIIADARLKIRERRNKKIRKYMNMNCCWKTTGVKERSFRFMWKIRMKTC